MAPSPSGPHNAIIFVSKPAMRPHWPQFEDPATFNQLQLEFLLDKADAASSAA